MNKYKHFQSDFTARRRRPRVRPSAEAQIAFFALTMFLVGAAFGYFLAASEAARIVAAFGN